MEYSRVRRYVSPELAEEFQDNLDFLRGLEKIAELDEKRKEENRDNLDYSPDVTKPQ